MNIGRGVCNDLQAHGEEENGIDCQRIKTYFEDFVVDPSRALSAILRVVITVVKGRQVAEIVRHLLHVHVFDDFIYPFLVPKVGPFCRDTLLS